MLSSGVAPLEPATVDARRAARELLSADGAAAAAAGVASSAPDSDEARLSPRLARLDMSTSISRWYCCFETSHAISPPCARTLSGKSALRPRPRSSVTSNERSRSIWAATAAVPPFEEIEPTESIFICSSVMWILSSVASRVTSLAPPKSSVERRTCTSVLRTVMRPRSASRPTEPPACVGSSTSGLPTSTSRAIADTSASSTDRAICATVFAVALISAPSTPLIR